MQKIIISLLFIFFTINSYSSTNELSTSDDIFVREHWISLTKSYDIKTKTNKLGTLYRRFFALRPTYDFYDPMNVKTATATVRFFAFGAHLDIFDQTNAFIGGVEEEVFTFFPTFEIISRDSYTRLARAEMNFWGTKFHIYDFASNQEMAIMSRSFFRFKNNWTINVTNKDLLEQKNIDSRVLMTVLAVQGELEDWKGKQDDDSITKAPHQLTQVQSNERARLTKQIADLTTTEKLDKLKRASDDSLEALADELDKGFDAENQLNGKQINEEKVKAFTNYCINLIHSNNLSDAKKKAILTLLNLRLQGHD